MAYGLPARGQPDWDDELNNSIESLRADVQTAKSDASAARSDAAYAKSRSDDAVSTSNAVATATDAQTAYNMQNGTQTRAYQASTFPQLWKPNTAYAVGDIRMAPDGSIVKRTVAGTSGSTYSGANWAVADGPAAAFVSTGSAGGLSHLYAATPASLKKWRAAMARVRSGGTDAKILCIGDSTTAGYGSNGVSAPGGPNSYPYTLASLLSYRMPAAKGLSVAPPSGGPDDTRWTAGAGWGRASGFSWGNNGVFKLNSTASPTSLVYADPGVTADRFDVYYLIGSGLGTVGVTATGGSTSTFSTANATASIGKVTVSAASAGTGNSVTILPTASSGAVYIIGVEPWLSTASKVRVGNAGSGGTKASAWAGDGTGAAWNSQAAIKAYAPDLTIISIGINDADTGVSAATYTTYIQKLATAAQVSGDVLFMAPVPSTSATTATKRSDEIAYAGAMKSLGLPFADLQARWVDGDSANGLGFMFDTLHPTGMGYADIAQFLSSLLLIA